MADLQGLLGGSLLPEQVRQGSHRDNMLGAIASTGAGMRQGLGQAVGMDTRTDGERAKEELGKLDPTNPADQEKIIALVAPINPQKAMEMRAQFEAENQASEQQAYDRGRHTKADKLAERRQVLSESNANKKTKGEQAKTEKRFDEDLQANVVDYYFPSNPTVVIKTRLAGRDETRMSVASQNRYAKIQDDKATAEGVAMQANRTADKLLKAIPEGGLEGDFDVWLSGIFGAQGEKEEARTMITNLINGNAIKNLPKGPASDKDIALVMKGEPPSNAGSEYLSAYAKGIAKLARAEARYFSDQQRWMDANDNLAGFATHQNVRKAEETLSQMKPEALKMMEDAYGTDTEAAVVAAFGVQYGFNLKEMKRALELDKQTLARFKEI